VAVTLLPGVPLSGKLTVVLTSASKGLTLTTVRVVLLALLGSITPAGGVTVAVLVSKPL
jgi:hypothetical protein